MLVYHKATLQSNIINLQYVCIEMSISNLVLGGSVGPSRTETATVIEANT